MIKTGNTPKAATPPALAVPSTPIIVAAYVMTFVAGIIDAVTLLSFTKITTTHVSGALLKVGIYGAEGSIQAIEPNGGMLMSFIIGAIVTGACTSTPSRKTPITAAHIAITIGILFGLVGALLQNGIREAIYLASFTAGLQNGSFCVNSKLK
jgi:uncharacterized membrane protein YoaK (UPF0700 family)